MRTQTTRSSRDARQRGRQVPPARRSRLWLWSLIGVGVIALIIAGVAYSNGGNIGPVGDIAGVETFQNVQALHQEGTINYPQTPPAGGPHNPVWQNCGTYNSPLIKENAVHSQEHGAVWITYRSDLPADQVAQLKELVRGRRYTLLSPYPGSPSPIVASAWGVQLKVESASDPRLAQFITKYMQGPQVPEMGATCQGGKSTSS